MLPWRLKGAIWANSSFTAVRSTNQWQKSLEVVRAFAGIDLVLDMELNQRPNSTAPILDAIQMCYKSLHYLIIFRNRLDLG